MNKLILIGITGKMGSGKSSAAEVFEKYGYARASFALPIKWVAQTYFFWDGRKDERGRKLLQKLGDVAREYDVDVFCRHMSTIIDGKMKVKDHDNEPCKIVIDDLRFENEANLIRSLDGIILHLDSDGYNMGELNNHVSEKGIPFLQNDVLMKFPKFDSKEIFMSEFEVEALESGLIKE